MPKLPVEYEPKGIVWGPKPTPKPKGGSAALWGWIALAGFAVLMLAQCS